MKEEVQIQRALVIGLLLLTVARLLIAGSHELSEDEAYYQMWSERLAPSYYSKGPGIALTMGLSTAVFGDDAFGVRFFSPILALLSSLVVFRLGRSLFDGRSAAWAVLLLNITPIFNAGATLMTIDPLSIFFWLAAMLALWIALHRASPTNLYWPLTGLLIGLGFLCKYTNALQLLSIVLLLVVARRWRGQLLKPGWLLMLGSFALCTIPVIVWNAQHGWITAKHLYERGSLDDKSLGINPAEFLEFFGGHFLVYSPVLFFGLLWALWRSLRFHVFRHDGVTFSLAFSLPILVMYFLLSFKQTGELNWTSPGFVTAGMVLAWQWNQADFSRRRTVWLRTSAVAAAVLLSLLMLNTDLVRRVGVVWSYGRDPLQPKRSFSEALRHPGRALDNAGDFSLRLRGWQSVSERIGSLAEEIGTEQGKPLFLIANRYQTAAVVGHYLDPEVGLLRPTDAHPKIHTIESPVPVHQFSFWPRYDKIRSRPLGTGDAIPEPVSPFMARDALFITDDPKRYTPPEPIQRGFESWRAVAVLEFVRKPWRDAREASYMRTVRVFLCEGYRGLDF